MAIPDIHIRSGSALMLVYHLGVLEELLLAKAYVPGKTRTTGSSGGAYIAVSTTTGGCRTGARLFVEISTHKPPAPHP
jgi:hypothetical protein